MNTRVRHRTDPGFTRGFTLIEIMVVVVILGILAALVAPNVMRRIDDAQITKVKQDMRAFETALSLYKMDNYKYPSTDQGLAALVTQPNDPSV
jgi:general secretion pathway protein G